MEENSILILGAGASGLAAAEVLSPGGFQVTLLEGRDRIGGRIHTLSSKTGNLPIELGAEFVHGLENDTWEVIRAAGLRMQKVPDRHWRAANGELTEDEGFWEALNRVSARINTAAPDQSFESFLDHAWSLGWREKKLARDYVEGFHAAPAARMSIHALAKAEAAAERDKATQQFRIAKGYGALLRWFEDQMALRKVAVQYHTLVKTIRWERGRVEVEAQTPAGLRRFQGARALVTLPLGVLKQQGPGTPVFEPGLPGKEKAIQSLEMGTVVKVTLQFSARFWPVENFGFLHAGEAGLPTWWADERGPLLTGWAGGPRAEQLSREKPDALLDEALRTLARLFKVEPKRLRELLVAGYTHDWAHDPFARGAYSYTPAGMSEMPKRLAAPVADTLFFAGEATDAEGEQGTVHAALASGKRAAREIMRSFSVSPSAIRQVAPSRKPKAVPSASQ